MTNVSLQQSGTIAAHSTLQHLTTRGWEIDSVIVLLALARRHTLILTASRDPKSWLSRFRRTRRTTLAPVRRKELSQGWDSETPEALYPDCIFDKLVSAISNTPEQSQGHLSRNSIHLVVDRVQLVHTSLRTAFQQQVCLGNRRVPKVAL